MKMERSAELRRDSYRGAILIAMFSAIFCMAGCSSHPPISKDAIAKLLLANLTNHCDPQTVSIRESRSGAVEARRALTWFDKTILNDPMFLRSADVSDSVERRGVLSYQDGGYKLQVNWSEFTPPDMIERDHLELRACIYVPERADLIDVAFDPDGRHGHVTFREALRLSAFGQKMSKAELFGADILEASQPQDYEYQAELEKAEPGGWGVRSVKVR